MVVGFVLIITSPMYEHEVYMNLLRNEKISEINPLFGEYDLIVKIDVDDYQLLGDIVINDSNKSNYYHKQSQILINQLKKIGVLS